jgi:hypothetical protein
LNGIDEMNQELEESKGELGLNFMINKLKGY